MADTDINNEFVDVKPESKPAKKSTVKGLLDGSLLARNAVLEQLPFVLFIVLLAIIYIGNRYHAERLIRETAGIQKELKDLRSEAITTSSDLMFISKQSEVTKLIEKKGLDLKESVEPPKIITIKK